MLSSDAASQNRVLVAGGGGAGYAAALLLARDGCDVVMAAPPASAPDGRTIALLDGSVRLLESLGVWSELERTAAPLRVMRLIDDTGSLFRTPPVEFRAAEIGLEQFGWNVEARALTAALKERTIANQSIDVRDAKVETLSINADCADVSLSDGTQVTAELVVAADGRRSGVRAMAGLRAQTTRYPQTALTAILAHSARHNDVSTEFHTRAGPCTLVPLPGRRSSLVWMMNPRDATLRMALNDAAFAEAVEHQVHSILGSMHVDGPRGSTPMSLVSVDRFTTSRVALVGEAAHAFPPIGAQGMNLGLRDVAHLAEAVAAARAQNSAIGSDRMLADYAQRRTLDVRTRTAAVDMLNRSLLSPFLPIDMIRGVGLTALDLIGPLRRAVMREGLAPQRGSPQVMRR